MGTTFTHCRQCPSPASATTCTQAAIRCVPEGTDPNRAALLTRRHPSRQHREGRLACGGSEGCVHAEAPASGIRHNVPVRSAKTFSLSVNNSSVTMKRSGGKSSNARFRGQHIKSSAYQYQSQPCPHVPCPLSCRRFCALLNPPSTP